jgi:hypothetical protein
MADKPGKADLLLAAAVLADMILGEWDGPLAYAVKTWGYVDDPEQLRAVEKLEAYLGAVEQGEVRLDGFSPPGDSR